MGAAEEWDGPDHGDEAVDDRHRLSAAPDAVEVRRNAGLAALVGVLGAGLAIAYLARASATGAWLDWSLAVVTAIIGIGFLRSFVDARTPLLVADAQGVRIRLGRTWHGLPWGALARVDHTPRHGLLRDGRLVLAPRNPDRVLAGLDAGGRRQARLASRLYGAPFAVPIGLGTRVSGTQDLAGALERLADGASMISLVEPRPRTEPDPVDAEPVPGDGEAVEAPQVPEPPVVAEDRPRLPRRLRDPRPALASAIGVLSARLERGRTAPEEPDGLAGEEEDDEGLAESPAPEREPEPTPTPEPARDTRTARRVDLVHAGEEAPEPLEGRQLHRPGSVSLVEDPVPWGDRELAQVRPIARPGEAVEPLVIDDLEARPAADPVIGPEIAAARTRLALSVDQLAERTRIRPHVIESIEVDDFAPCGGDFYARGHLRTLARVLGIDVSGLLAAYDERYADAPISPRRVFEAELATSPGGAIRGTRGGPNWSVLVAAVMALVLVWSVARLLMDAPGEVQEPAPVLNGSAGVANGQAVADPVEVELRSVQGGASVVVRDATGEVVFEGDVAHGETQEVDAAPPVQVESSDAGAIEIHLAGRNRGTLGQSGMPGRGTFIVR